MANKGLLVLIVIASLLFIVASGCTSTLTVTAPAQTVFITSPAATLTIPGGTVTLPAATVTLPGKTTTIPATVATFPPATNTPPPAQVSGGFLPTTPPSLDAHMADLSTILADQCTRCHGPTLYLQFPMAPSWDGNAHSSLSNTGFYIVIPGSIQDHTGRTDDQCLTCHALPKS
jgi:hypothetical protein